MRKAMQRIKKMTFQSKKRRIIEPITEVDLDVQFTRMNPEKFEDILQYAEKTYYGEQYLWGAEWWYWLHLQGRSDMWDRAKELYKK